MPCSRSFARTCCSTPEKLASCETNSVESIGFSGSWLRICVVRRLQEGLEVAADAAVARPSSAVAVLLAAAAVAALAVVVG